MLTSCVPYIETAREELLALQRKYKRAFWDTRSYADYRLAIQNKKGGQLYYLRKRAPVGAGSDYLRPADSREVANIQKRYFLNILLDRIDECILAMDRFLRDFHDIDPTEIWEKLPRAYRFPSEIAFDELGVVTPGNWAHRYRKYNAASRGMQSDYYPESLKQTTERGEMVRSKGEALIANALFARGIPYLYEEPLEIDGDRLLPDFTLYSERTGRTLYWEHGGLMDSPAYVDRFIRRLSIYAKAGIFAGDRLITTFDEASGNTDTEWISRIIDLYI